MASLNEQQDARDAESFDNDRKEGRYDRDYFSLGSGPDLSICPDRAADIARITAETNALIERAFGPKSSSVARAA
jgi:hypothetical protein